MTWDTKHALLHGTPEELATYSKLLQEAQVSKYAVSNEAVNAFFDKLTGGENDNK